MQTIIRFVRSKLLIPLVVTGLTTAALAQEVSIPYPGLEAAVRDALQKPTGPLTETDLLSLTSLNTGNRNISDELGRNSAPLPVFNHEP